MANKVQTCPLLMTAWLPEDRDNSSSSAAARCHHRRYDKIVVIMGATGTGESRLSIDLATRFPFSDKTQVYKGLDITANKFPFHEQLGVARHLFSEFDAVQAPSFAHCQPESSVSPSPLASVSNLAPPATNSASSTPFTAPSFASSSPSTSALASTSNLASPTRSTSNFAH